jgi:hypothetical protein
MMKSTRLPLIAAALAAASLMAACGAGGDDDPALPGDASSDVVAKYIGSWQSDCFKEGSASGRARADFTKNSPTSLSGDIVVYAYLGGSCSGPAVKDEKVLSNFTLNHAGTKTVEGVTADKFTGTADQKNGKLVLFANGNSLRVGDVDGALDAEGYANAFFDSRYTLKRLN